MKEVKDKIMSEHVKLDMKEDEIRRIEEGVEKALKEFMEKVVQLKEKINRNEIN